MPLGVYRTWVKTTETGVYPDTQRHFQVTRCNHCANPPCVRICPTQAMYQRADGIVEFDGDACIGCKACMQACPYDAIYIDPETQTAAKCHYCSHRIELELEPACVVVCPEHAIISGDLDDPSSEISGIVTRNQVTVSKPEQGTAPKLFYIQGSDVNLHPTAAETRPRGLATVDLDRSRREQGRASARRVEGELRRGRSGQQLRAPQAQGQPLAGPIQIGGRRAEHMVQVGYRVHHKMPWHWPVPAYLVTKGVAAGIVVNLAFALFFLDLRPGPELASLSGFVALVAMAATTALLVFDLEKPERFLYILLRPNWSSWLARGAVVLIGMSALVGLWFALELAVAMGWLKPDLMTIVRGPLLAACALFGVGTAIYTAFLFGQAEGRDLWQSPLLPPHLLVQAVMAGAAVLLLIAAVVPVSEALLGFFHWSFAAALVADLFMVLLGEFGMPHASEVAARAAHEIRRGRYARLFWVGAILLGHGLPLLLLLLPGFSTSLLAGCCCLVGLYCFEHAFVMAPQEVPNS
ncbi:MAG: 4Fe-4S ferredoxin [Rickettsiales bacterium]|nr:4Fe-4S ferredoxin [Rickettsiales bacterium]